MRTNDFVYKIKDIGYYVSYKDMLKEARDKTIKQLNTQSDKTQEK